MAQNDNPHARVKRLARSAMEAAAANNNEAEEGSYRKERANYEARRLKLREEGIARGRAHNQELHEQAQIRKHGGYQRALPI